MRTVTDPDLFPAAAAVIEERGWVQGAIETPDGQVCATGALRHCDLVAGDWIVARSVMRHRHHGEIWNDGDGTTEPDVLAWLRTAPPVTDDELAVVYGPQWADVVALIRRTAVLTGEEARRMAAAWSGLDAVGAAVRAAARAAAQVATRTAAQVAARDAARDAATRAAAWEAAAGAFLVFSTEATFAAWATVTRDLIGTAGYTQAHYDTLMAPWLSVVGETA